MPSPNSTRARPPDTSVRRRSRCRLGYARRCTLRGRWARVASCPGASGFLQSISSTCAFTSWPDPQHVLWMIHALLGGDIADVDHAFHPFGKLHKRAKLVQAGDRCLPLRTHRESLRDVGPGVAQGLLESQRNAALRRVDSQDDRFHGSPGLSASAGLRTSSTTTSRKDGSGPRRPVRVRRRRRNRPARDSALHAVAGLILLAGQSHGCGCSCFRPIAMRRLAASTLSTLASTCCPAAARRPVC